MRALTQLLTGRDNQTHDLGRWSWAGSFATVLGATAWNAYQGATIDLTALAGALGIVSGSHGAALWAKAATEPSSDARGQP